MQTHMQNQVYHKLPARGYVPNPNAAFVPPRIYYDNIRMAWKCSDPNVANFEVTQDFNGYTYKIVYENNGIIAKYEWYEPRRQLATASGMYNPVEPFYYYGDGTTFSGGTVTVTTGSNTTAHEFGRIKG